MKDGAPLRATARFKRAKFSKKTRPDMREQREKFKAEWAKKVYREYSESSRGERKEYEDEAKPKADEPEVLDEDDNAMDDEIPTVPGLWGLNDKFNPAAYKYLKKTFLNPVGADEDADYGEEDEQLPAWTAASSSFRSSFVHAGIVTEDTHPGIHEKAKLKYKKVCREAHHGICKAKVGSERAKVKRLAKCIHENVDERRWYKIITYADLVMLDVLTFYCCHRRPRGPMISMLIPCKGEGSLELETYEAHGRTYFRKYSQGEFASTINGTGITSAWLQPVDIKSRTNSFVIVDILHIGETGQIFQRVAPKPRKKSDMKIHDPAHEAMVEGMHSLFKSEQPQHDPFNQKGSNVSARTAPGITFTG